MGGGSSSQFCCQPICISITFQRLKKNGENRLNRKSKRVPNGWIKDNDEITINYVDAVKPISQRLIETKKKCLPIKDQGGNSQNFSGTFVRFFCIFGP